CVELALEPVLERERPVRIGRAAGTRPTGVQAADKVLGTRRVDYPARRDDGLVERVGVPAADQTPGHDVAERRCNPGLGIDGGAWVTGSAGRCVRGPLNPSDVDLRAACECYTAAGQQRD